MRIYYIAPDYDEPSWGIGMLYAHVRALREMGAAAWVVHQQPGFRPAWLEIAAPVVALGEVCPDASDVLVVPEVLVEDPWVLRQAARRLVFVQGAFVLLARPAAAMRLRELGYERVVATMPHVAEVAAAVADLPVTVVPPMVASYFWPASRQPLAERPRRVVVFAKAGVPDYGPVVELLRAAVDGLLPGLVPAAARGSVGRWEVVELRGLRHTAAAELLQRSRLFVNVNCYEAFNATVPEAMAAGAVCLCYEAYGGRDFLRDQENGFVFSNNSLFPLVRSCVELMSLADTSLEQRVAGIRERAWETAAGYTEGAMRRPLAMLLQQLGASGRHDSL